MRVGIAADHGGFDLKEALSQSLRKAGFAIVDYAPRNWMPGTITQTLSCRWQKPWRAAR